MACVCGHAEMEHWWTTDVTGFHVGQTGACRGCDTCLTTRRIPDGHRFTPCRCKTFEVSGA